MPKVCLCSNSSTGVRVLQTGVAAVPVRLMKKDLLFIAEQMPVARQQAAGDGRPDGLIGRWTALVESGKLAAEDGFNVLQAIGQHLCLFVEAKFAG